MPDTTDGQERESDESELPHVVADPWPGPGDVVGHKIDPPYGLIITAISDLRGWLRNCAEQTNTDDQGKTYQELVVPVDKVMGLIDKLQQIDRTYLEEQEDDRNNFVREMNAAGARIETTNQLLIKAVRRVNELKLLNRGLRLAVRDMVKKHYR